MQLGLTSINGILRAPLIAESYTSPYLPVTNKGNYGSI
jgi:hypothetical protein